MTTELPGECFQRNSNTRLGYSFYRGIQIRRLKWSISSQMQEKTAFEDTSTRDTPPYSLLSTTCDKQVPMDNLSSMKNRTAAHATERRAGRTGMLLSSKYRQPAPCQPLSNTCPAGLFQLLPHLVPFPTAHL